MTKLSVVIITKNESHNIERCIKSCKALQAEIIVLDSQSTDDTIRLAQNLGAQVHTVDWKGYGATKNYGAQLAKHDWILSLDADEALDKNLQESILESLQNEPDLAGCWLYRVLIFEGKKLLFGAPGNEKRLRFYNKQKLQWNDSPVHEDMEPIDQSIDWPTATLQGSLLHYSYTDVNDMRMRLEKYAQLSTQKLKDKSPSYLMFKRIFSPSFSFIKNYIFRLGFWDGRAGLFFAKEHTRYIKNKYRYALMEQNKK